MLKPFFFATLLLCLPTLKCYGDTLSNAEYQLCFTPKGECTDLIAKAIDNAKKSVLVQAYSFTSAPIAKALVNANKRGVSVKVILDKSQFTDKYSSSKFLLNQNIPLWKDAKVAIAHNKVIIIDDTTVITGSFNFTKAAQEKNAENVMLISHADVAKKYTQNWNERLKDSEKMN